MTQPKSQRSRLLLTALITAGAMLSPLSAFSQTPSPAPATNASSMDATPGSKPMSRTEQRANKKAASHANRMKKNAELKTLEKNGYNPSANNVNYPADLQNAQKKAAGQ